MEDLIRELDKLRREFEEAKHFDLPTVYLPFLASVVQPISAGAEVARATPPRAMSIITLKISAYVDTTNNTSNYWTFKLQELNAGVASDITNATVNTSAISVGVWSILSATVGTAVAATADEIQLVTVKTNSPGNLYWGHPLVHYT